MREATNLSWTDTPFGAARRPFAERISLLAAFSVMATIPPPAAAAVYLRLPRAHTLPVTDTTLRFGFHAVAAENSAEALAVVTTLDALLVQARRQAAILAGHRLADELALLAAGHGQPTRGITAVTAAWRGTTAEQGLARLHDTATEPTPAPLAAMCAGYHLHGLHPGPDPSPDLVSARSTTSAAAPQILRQTVIRALAIALIAARNAGHYQWADLHLDVIVEAAAWDQTTGLPAQPVP